MVEVIRERIPEGANTTHPNTTHPKGAITHLPTQRDRIKVQMIMMSMHLTFLIHNVYFQALLLLSYLLHSFPMNIYMILQPFGLIT